MSNDIPGFYPLTTTLVKKLHNLDVTFKVNITGDPIHLVEGSDPPGFGDIVLTSYNLVAFLVRVRDRIKLGLTSYKYIFIEKGLYPPIGPDYYTNVEVIVNLNLDTGTYNLRLDIDYISEFGDTDFIWCHYLHQNKQHRNQYNYHSFGKFSILSDYNLTRWHLLGN